eukprot:m.16857 g.16857  ORF g.16857 m.16857 type:complete len:272 (+) comp8064_c0_seq1:309-1124(+)
MMKGLFLLGSLALLLVLSSTPRDVVGQASVDGEGNADVSAAITFNCPRRAINRFINKVENTLAKKLARQCAGVSASSISNIQVVGGDIISIETDADTLANLEACIEDPDLVIPLRVSRCAIVSIEQNALCPASGDEFEGAVHFNVSFNGRGRRFSLGNRRQRNHIFKRLSDVLLSVCNISPCHLVLNERNDVCVVDSASFELQVSSQSVAEEIAECLDGARVPLRRKVWLDGAADVSGASECFDDEETTEAASTSDDGSGDGGLLDLGGLI